MYDVILARYDMTKKYAHHIDLEEGGGGVSVAGYTTCE